MSFCITSRSKGFRLRKTIYVPITSPYIHVRLLLVHGIHTVLTISSSIYGHFYVCVCGRTQNPFGANSEMEYCLVHVPFFSTTVWSNMF